MVVCDGLKGLPERGQCRVGEDHRANMYRPSTAEFLQVRVEKGLGADRERPQAGIHRRVRDRKRSTGSSNSPGKWEKRYPAIIRLWENAWAEFVPFLAFDREIRTVICTTNAIESINARLRRAVNARGHFPTEQAALKCLYLAIMSLDPTGKGRKRWTNRWKTALNAFDITTAASARDASNNRGRSYTGYLDRPPSWQCR